MAHACFDLLVIGSGPAGQKAALNAVKLGKRVAIVDRAASLGGVCIHTGTIPSKAIREAVLHLTGLRERSVYGEGYAVKQHITMADLVYRRQHVIRTEVDVIRNQMGRNSVSMYIGEAAFLGPHTPSASSATTIEVTEIKAHHILIAVGTDPAHPANVPFTPGASSTATNCSH